MKSKMRTLGLNGSESGGSGRRWGRSLPRVSFTGSCIFLYLQILFCFVIIRF